MSTPELHDFKHVSLDKEIDYLKGDSIDTKNRIILLEKSESLLNEQMKNTMNSIESLITWIKWGLGMGMGSYLAFFTWMLQQQLK